MKRILKCTIISLLLLTACSNEASLPTKQEPKKKYEENILITDDGKITFKVFNTVKAPKSTVDSIKKEISTAYNNIHRYIETGYVPSQRINVFLLEGDQASWGLKSEIKLYSIRKGKYPLVHELTHTLLGYGDNFDTSKGYFTQEGFAIFMENKYGKQDYPVHKVMKNFIMSQKTIPLHKLVSVESDDALFRSPLVELEDLTMQWMSYTYAGSFVTYLIENYGLEKFEKVYNQSNLDQKFQETYGKSTLELEKEWLLFIEENYEELDTEDKMKIDYFYEKISVVDLIDKEIFKRP